MDSSDPESTLRELLMNACTKTINSICPFVTISLVTT